MGDFAGAGVLLKAVGIGVVPGVAVLAYLIMSALLKFLNSKSEKDRAEHMAKWDSMVALQKETVATQKESMQQIISGSREDLDRLYQLYERQTKSLEAVSHHMTTLTNAVERKSFCPIASSEE